MLSIITDGAASPKSRRHRPSWSSRAAAAWCLLFAARGAYWAVGGTAGLGTLAHDLRRQAAERATASLVVLWATIVLELVGAVIAVCLARSATSAATVPTSKTTAAYFLAIVGGVTLVGHGVLFSTFGFSSSRFTSSEQWWYGAFWGPWFTTGGVLFLLAGRAEHARRDLRPDMTGRAGVALGVALTAIQTVLAGTA